MKKMYLIIAAFLSCGIFATSCLKDEGNYDYKDLGDFYVDTVGKAVSLTIKQFETLTMPSNLVYEGEKSGLSYKWELYKTSESIRIGTSSYGTGFSHGYTREDFPDRTIAETENLSFRVTHQPGSYYLVFSATNNETGYAAFMRYTVSVEGTVGTGLAVLYKGSNGIDIDVVATPVLNGNLTETSYVRNAYSIANQGRPFAGEPRNLVLASAGTNYLLYLTSSEDAVRLSTFDMSVAHEFKDLFAGTPPAIKDVNGIMITGSNHIFINAGVMYKYTAYGTVPILAPLGMPGGTYDAAPFAHFTYGNNAITYDKVGRRFIFSTMWGAEIIPAVNSSPNFNLGDVGKDLVYWGKGFYESLVHANYCIFKNPTDDGNRYLYVFVANMAAPASYTVLTPLDITSCPEIATAAYFAFGERGPVAFYATESDVYQLAYNLSSSTVLGATSVWSSPAGEKISAMKLFKQTGLNLANSASDKYLMVATWNTSAGKGKLYLLEADISSGILQPSPAAVYDFDGKISDFDFINR
jgi:hypothetical protein